MKIKKVDIKKDVNISDYLKNKTTTTGGTKINDIEKVDLNANYFRIIDDMDNGIAVQKAADTKVDSVGKMKVYQTIDNNNVDKIIDIDIKDETSHIATGNKSMEQLREELSLYDGKNGNADIDIQFAAEGSKLSDQQTQLLNKFDLFCNEKGLTQKEKMDWAYMIGRESTFKTSAEYKKHYGIGQLTDDNIDTYSSDPQAYRNGNAIVQLDTTLKYIMDRYGSMDEARAFWDKNGWY